MKHDTNNIDEAAYLALQGYSPTVRRTGPKSAVFSFEKDERFDEARARFWKGEATVQLHGWLATRTALKNECYGQAHSEKRVASPPLAPAQHGSEPFVTKGMLYWFREGSAIKRVAFGKNPLHRQRLASSNVYLTRDDARLGRNAISDRMIEQA